MHSFTTPMMKQYMVIKEKYADCFLFYRLGDFYELFLEDAQLGSEILQITLTSRPRGRDGAIPMAGVPYHAADQYIAKLVGAGYKVAICEQVSDPKLKGLVEREVIRVITPGTVLEGHTLLDKEHTSTAALLRDDLIVAIAYSDVSTGLFHVLKKNIGGDLEVVILELLSKIVPKEIILPPHLYNDPIFLGLIKKHTKAALFPFHEWESVKDVSKEILLSHFNITTLDTFALDTELLLQQSAAMLLTYLKSVQKDELHHIRAIHHIHEQSYMRLDTATMRNLELFETVRDRNQRGSLLSVLDSTKTAMGGRLLREWILRPLLDKKAIQYRQNYVERLVKRPPDTHEIREQLKTIYDIERISTRISLGIAVPPDVLRIRSALEKALSLYKFAVDQKIHQSETLITEVVEKITKLIEHITIHIQDTAPVDITSGSVIQEGVDKKLDRLRSIIHSSKQSLANIEKSEREKTGISSLKVRFNKVFGYYIEVRSSQAGTVPKSYMRKQTLVNAERFVTPELTRHEEEILSAEEVILEIERRLYMSVLATIAQEIEPIQLLSDYIAELDCLAAFAHNALDWTYVKPKIVSSRTITIANGRHPVIEQGLESPFVPNDTDLNSRDRQLLLLTGPNMGGKSVYMRQVALLVLMAQVGSFVPADTMEFGIIDTLFVRSGASDAISLGLSTFMVEMTETANIIHNLTPDSLIIMDEIGRGTSTYDGISIAWAIAEYIVTHPYKPKTLFATHYHELQDLATVYPNSIVNMHAVVEEVGNNLVFMHRIDNGAASHSYGIVVAQLAGLPGDVIVKAKTKLSSIEQGVDTGSRVRENKTISSDVSITDELRTLDLSTLTPVESLVILDSLQKKLRT